MLGSCLSLGLWDEFESEYQRSQDVEGERSLIETLQLMRLLVTHADPAVIGAQCERVRQLAGPSRLPALVSEVLASPQEASTILRRDVGGSPIRLFTLPTSPAPLETWTLRSRLWKGPLQTRGSFSCRVSGAQSCARFARTLVSKTSFARWDSRNSGAPAASGPPSAGRLVTTISSSSAYGDRPAGPGAHVFGRLWPSS